MAASSVEVDLLGEPRLKNGLTYYPGVRTDKGSVLLGNIVRLQLQAEGALPYIGYGYLKGLWLWREQPYIRVQYMAPSRTDLPDDAIAYREEPDPSQLPELMVTNRVGDLHLNALLGPVFIEGGPLLSQLFQENLGADADGFMCSRHLDPAVQRVQPLDEAFRLTPIVQAFPKAVLRAILDAEAPAGACRVPACCTSVPGSAATAVPRAAATEVVSPPETRFEDSQPLLADADEEAAVMMGAATTAVLARASPVPAASGNTELYSAAERPASSGFGPSSSKQSILLQATYRGAIFRPSLIVRCPAERKELYEKLESIFGLLHQSVKVVYQRGPGQWEELGMVADLVEALDRQPELKALPVQVSGEQMLHLPFFHALAAVIAVANLAAIVIFSYLVAYVPGLPMPWIAIVLLAPLLLMYNGYAAVQSISDEYVMNVQLRAAFARKDGWLVMFMLISLLGPDVLLLFARVQLPRIGASISKSAEREIDTSKYVGLQSTCVIGVSSTAPSPYEA